MYLVAPLAPSCSQSRATFSYTGDEGEDRQNISQHGRNQLSTHNDAPTRYTTVVWLSGTQTGWLSGKIHLAMPSLFLCGRGRLRIAGSSSSSSTGCHEARALVTAQPTDAHTPPALWSVHVEHPSARCQHLLAIGFLPIHTAPVWAPIRTISIDDERPRRGWARLSRWVCGDTFGQGGEAGILVPHLALERTPQH